MHFPGNMTRSYLIFLLVTVFFHESFSQDSYFRNYSTDTDPALTNRFINTIDEDSNGFLWIGTGSGLNRFDGLHFRSDFLPDSLKETNINCSYKTSDNKLWFGSKDGIVLVYDGKSFTIISLRDSTSNAITGFVETEDNEIIFSTQNKGLIKTSMDEPGVLSYFSLDQKLITTIGKSPDGKLLVGSNDGLYFYSMPVGKQPPQFIRKCIGIPDFNIQSIQESNTPGLTFIGTSENGLYLLQTQANGNTLVINPLAENEALKRISIKSVLEDHGHNLWISTSRSGLIKVNAPWVAQEKVNFKWYNKKNGLLSNNTRDVFQDFEGNIWVGTYGKGLCMLLDEAFSFKSFDGKVPGESINAMAEDDDRYFIAGDNGVEVMDKISGLKIRDFSVRNGLPEDKITSIYFYEKQNFLFVGTNISGLYVISLESGKVRPFFLSQDKNERSINYVTGENNHLWLGTRNGLFMFDLLTGENNHFSVSSGQLPHNNIRQIFIENENKIWLSTLSDGLYFLDGDERVLRKAGLSRKDARFDINAISEGRNGRIWAATNGSGLVHVYDDTTYFVTTRTGLMSDYCYSLLIDKQGDVWVGHRKGYSRVTRKGHNYLIRTYGRNEGFSGDANPNASKQLKDERILFGTNKGMIIYNPMNDKESLSPPRVNILSLQFSSEKINLTLNELPKDRRILLPYSNYKLRIDYVGISYKNPGKVQYQYQLENYDPEWSDLVSNTFVDFPKMDDGEYTFYLKAFNSEYQTTEQPASFVIVVVKKPFWKTWWFFTILLIAMVAGVVSIIRIRERNHRLREERLTEELDIRTKEVVEKKEELEVKNREITDSINYAQRIQASILPPLAKLKSHFKGSFVYFEPRDIVSGDFYWWQQVGSDRFMVICADSTGHGVPGAFMSMIGSTLIKDIVGQNPGIKPSGLLTLLNQEIIESLNQKVNEGEAPIDNEHFSTSDGMDIIVCEFNTKTRLLRYASAMRPIIMYHQGEQLYIRGSRSSVGGDMFFGRGFEDQEFHLEKGDVVYLFSDGYPDQFGGPGGKKYKMTRLKELLAEIHEMDMDEQYRVIKKSFEDWKGDQDQVDDVLFMGIQV
ncbi:MAG: hypothetical protein DRI73_00395 [Bacteroidetes bacterium]|nr:MAG: hypothetical protein DRI73_00395 [Bacteroidota bacterium]